jgi:hypothetical protein
MKKVHKERIQKWIKALRSGQYKQCKEQLRNNNKYCCLGVACDIVPNAIFEDCDVSLPLSVTQYYNFKNSYVPLRVPDSVMKNYVARCKQQKKRYVNVEKEMRSFEEDEGLYATLLNDEYGFTFKEIADCIEYTYLKKHD